ncbi:MAG: hypothetical protein ACE5FU_00175, partial [Nitrospinota bacterium]
LLFVLIIFLFPVSGGAATVDELEKRVDELENEVMIAQEAGETVNNMVAVSGYVDMEYTTTDEKGKEDGFRMHHLSIFLKKQLTEKLRFFSEIEFEDAVLFEFSQKTVTDKDGKDQKVLTHSKGDAAGGKIFAEAINADYLLMPQLNIRIGRFFTPAGIWSVDHYPPFVATQERPLHIRKIFPQLVDGAMIYGTQGLGNTNIFLKYDLYFGNGEGNSGKKDLNGDKAIGLKTSLLLPFLNHLEIGGTYYADTLNSGNSVNSYGFHSKVRAFGFTWQSEYALGAVDPAGTGAFDRTGFYSQLLYDWREFSVGYRYDYYESDDSKKETGSVRNSYILNYRISHEAVIKFEHHQLRPELPLDAAKPQVRKTTISLVLSLGN